MREDVAAILFDEPLTVIDPHLKWLLRRKLKEVHTRFRHTLVYVTHDQNEALTFAEKVVVMYEGEVVQLGTPQELFERPAHRFVGYFIGSPGMNFLPCRLERRRRAHRRHRRRARRSTGPRPRSEFPNAKLELGIRPGVRGRQQPAPDETTLPAQVERVEDLGNYKLVTARLGPHHLKAKLAEDAAVAGRDRASRLRAGADAALRRRPADRLTGPSMDKTHNNRAWLLVLPVFLLVAFSAIIPLMTVVNYAFQDIFGPQRPGLGRHRLVRRRCWPTRTCTTRPCPPARLQPDRAGDRDPARHRAGPGDAGRAASRPRRRWWSWPCRC